MLLVEAGALVVPAVAVWLDVAGGEEGEVVVAALPEVGEWHATSAKETSTEAQNDRRFMIPRNAVNRDGHSCLSGRDRVRTCDRPGVSRVLFR